MNIRILRNVTLAILTAFGMLAFGGCSEKPTSEEIAAQVKAVMEEEKAKEQAEQKAKEEAAAAEAAAAAAQAPAPTPVPPKPAPRPRATAQAKPPAPAPVEKVVCTNCGVVVSVTEIEEPGKASGAGAVAGAVTGGVVGHQVGEGRGKDLATAAGVVGGAIAGHKIEQSMKKTRVYDVAVRMDTGEERVLRYDTAPGVVAGDKVRVENGRIVRQ